MKLSKTQGIVAVVIFFVVSGILILLSNLFIKEPNNHNERRFGVVNLTLEGWEGQEYVLYRNWMNESLTELNKLGPTFRINNNAPNAFRVRNVQLANCNNGPGEYDPITRSIRIDPVCIQGDLEFRTLFIHEVGHAVGMQHVCRSALEDVEVCSPVGFGKANMNPVIFRRNGPETITPVYQIQRLDIQEFCRTHRCD